MQLEIKHFAPYLPYDLKAQVTDLECNTTVIDEVETISNECITFKKSADFYFDGSSDIEVKPILRPLYDLKNEITHNGETFIPIDWLEQKYYTLSLHKECERLMEEDGHNWINQMSYLLILHLLEWHFDIDNLIDEGLAVKILAS